MTQNTATLRAFFSDKEKNKVKSTSDETLTGETSGFVRIWSVDALRYWGYGTSWMDNDTVDFFRDIALDMKVAPVYVSFDDAGHKFLITHRSVFDAECSHYMKGNYKNIGPEVLFGLVHLVSNLDTSNEEYRESFAALKKALLSEDIFPSNEGVCFPDIVNTIISDISLEDFGLDDIDIQILLRDVNESHEAILDEKRRLDDDFIDEKVKRFNRIPEHELTKEMIFESISFNKAALFLLPKSMLSVPEDVSQEVIKRWGISAIPQHMLTEDMVHYALEHNATDMMRLPEDILDYMRNSGDSSLDNEAIKKSLIAHDWKNGLDLLEEGAIPKNMIYTMTVLSIVGVFSDNALRLDDIYKNLKEFYEQSSNIMVDYNLKNPNETSSNHPKTSGFDIAYLEQACNIKKNGGGAMARWALVRMLQNDILFQKKHQLLYTRAKENVKSILINNLKTPSFSMTPYGLTDLDDIVEKVRVHKETTHGLSL